MQIGGDRLTAGNNGAKSYALVDSAMLGIKAPFFKSNNWYALRGTA